MQQCALHIRLPTYNRVVELERAVNSIVGQTYPHWTLHISNNCSTDATAEYLDSISKCGDLRIKVESHGIPLSPHKNIVSAIRETRADMFCWLSDDDWFDDSEYFEQVAAAYFEFKASVIYGARKLVDENNQLIKMAYKPSHKTHYPSVAHWFAYRPKAEVINMSGVFMNTNYMSYEQIETDPGAGWAWDEYVFSLTAGNSGVLRIPRVSMIMTYKRKGNNVERESPLRILQSARIHGALLKNLVDQSNATPLTKILALITVRRITDESIFIPRILRFERYGGLKNYLLILKKMRGYYQLSNFSLIGLKSIAAYFRYLLPVK